MKTLLALAAAVFFAAPGPVAAQAPRQTASATLGGKTVSISYTGPSVRGRKVFSAEGPIAKDGTYPVWRAGADSATALHTEADLEINGLKVPKGDYTLFVNLKDVNNWELIVNKQTGQWGLTYSAAQDLGRVKMTMAKPAAPVETLKYTLTGSGNTGKLTLEWENYSASVNVTAK
jgi:hypothetical protein